MKRGLIRIAGAAMAWGVAAWLQCAHAGAASFDIKQDEPETGSSLRQKIGTANVPLDRTYSQLNAAALQKVNESFPKLSAGDEPPFPETALKPLVSALSKLRFNVQGVVHASLVATVSAAGQVQSVRLVEATDDSLTEVATQALARAKFKPARCGGSPCEMEFPLQIEVRGFSGR